MVAGPVLVSNHLSFSFSSCTTSPGEVPHNGIAEPESPTLPSTPTREDLSSDDRSSPIHPTFSSNGSPTPISNLNTTIAASPTRSINLASSPATSASFPISSFRNTMSPKTSTSEPFGGNVAIFHRVKNLTLP